MGYRHMKALLTFCMLGLATLMVQTSFAGTSTSTKPEHSVKMQLAKGQYMMPGRCWADCGAQVECRQQQGNDGYHHHKA